MRALSATAPAKVSKGGVDDHGGAGWNNRSLVTLAADVNSMQIHGLQDKRLSWEEATRRCPDGVQPACHNAEDSVTVSGAAEAVAKFVQELKAESVFLREVDSSGIAFHSKYMESVRPAFLEAMQKSVLRRSVGADATCLGLMKRDADNLSFFLNSLGQLHSLGVKFDPSPLYPPVPLPVPRGTPNIAHLVSWDHSQQWTVAKWNDFATSAQVKHFFRLFWIMFAYSAICERHLVYLKQTAPRKRSI
ncbi:hypothetical protein HPB49_004327 [Dermacentor silvarum]|uniref:Uncharacterized protein n=1 Tax=Dermacentor silvarum TaxID=543639 RepID=A0ACB8D2E1_DERSI|nr:hypothetical protein HPB49_004327 [Dermacentor silvarum]